MTSKYKKAIKLEYIFIFFVFIVIAMLIPLTSGDDLDWGSKGGLARLANGFDNYNGRYVGNLVILAITRSTILRVLFYSVINTILVYGISKLSLFPSKITPIVTTLLLLIIPYSVYAQTFGWFSGFANYNVAISLTLLIWFMVMAEKSSYYLILIPILTLLAQLCMENVTIFNVMISIGYFIFRLKKRPIKEFLYCLSSILGALIMFSNSVYQSIANNQDGYRTFNVKMIANVLFTEFSQQYFVDNWLILLILAILSLIIYKEKGLFSKSIRLVIILFPISCLLFSNIKIRLVNIPAFVSIIFFIVGIVFLLSIVHIITKMKMTFEDKGYLIFIGVCTGLIISPMLIITPFGPRVMLTSYVFFVILTNSLLGVIRERLLMKNFQQQFDAIFKYLTIICFTLLVCVHSVNLYSINYRAKHFDIDHKSKTVTTYRVPFEQYGHFITPPASVPKANKTFKEKYNIPQDYDLIFKIYSNSLLEK